MACLAVAIVLAVRPGFNINRGLLYKYSPSTGNGDDLHHILLILHCLAKSMCCLQLFGFDFKLQKCLLKFFAIGNTNHC